MNYKNALKVVCRNLVNTMIAYNNWKNGKIQEWEFLQVLELSYRDAANILKYLDNES